MPIQAHFFRQAILTAKVRQTGLVVGVPSGFIGRSVQARIQRITRSSATAEIARDADDVDFSVDDVHSALILARPSHTVATDEP